MIETITQYIVLCTPALASIVSTIIIACRILKNFRSLKDDVKRAAAKDELLNSIQSNIDEIRDLKEVLIKEMELKTNTKGIVLNEKRQDEKA